MADEVTSTSKSSAKSSSAKDSVTSVGTVEATKPEQDVLIPVAESDNTDAVDHNKKIHDALDAARDAMLASGMSEGDADAYLNSARPRGVSTVVGNYADLNRMTGLPDTVAPTVSEDRLHFALKVDKDAPVAKPTEAQEKELKAASQAAQAQEKKDNK